MWERFTIENLTPLFTAGGNQDKVSLPSEGIRVPSLKSLIRFWFRALYRDSYGSMEALTEREQELFGTVSRGKKGGQGKIFLRSMRPNKGWKLWSAGEKKLSHDLTYLGYGIIDYRQGPTRPCFRPHNHFDFDVRFSAPDQKIREEFYWSLWALCQLGGIGAKSRRAWGSVQVTSEAMKGMIQSYGNYQNPEEVANILEKAFFSGQKEETLPDYTYFSPSQYEIYVHKESADKSIDVLKKLNQAMIDLRSNQSIKKQANDYKTVSDFVNTNVLDAIPQRAFFGLPHNYTFRSKKNQEFSSASFEPENPRKYGRRASPLFISVSRFEEKYYTTLCLIKSKFLPVKMCATRRKGRNKDRSQLIEIIEDWTLLENFIVNYMES